MCLIKTFLYLCRLKIKTMTNNTTPKELAVLKAFADNEYTAMYGMYDDYRIQGGTWMFSIKDYSGLKGKEFSGVVSSLTKKGFVDSDVTGDPNMIGTNIKDTWTMWMSDKGFKALQEAIKKAQL